MSIKFTYTISSVDVEARCMEIIYASEGRMTMHIGARLPFEGESLESIVLMFAPIRYWEEQEMPVSVPQVGASGSITPLTVDSQVATPASGSLPSTVL